MQPDTTKASTYVTVGIVVSVSLHVLFLGLMLVSCLGKEEQPPLIKEITIPAGNWEAIPVQPVAPEQPAVKPKEPEPPTPPEPEPPKPPESEPPKPKEPEPAKVEAPKPKEVVKPKTRDEIMKERLNAAPKSKTTPQPSQPKRDNSKELTDRLSKAAQTISASSVKFGSPNPNKLVGAQLSAYDKYMVTILGPIMQGLWDQLGPERLNSIPKNVQVTMIVSPAGKVLSAVISVNSDNQQMNDGAKKLAGKMLGRQNQPFSAVGLTNKQNLTFIFDLEYRQGSR